MDVLVTQDLFGDFCRGLGKLDSQKEALNVAKDQKENGGHRHHPSTGTVRADKPEVHDTQNHLATTEARVQRDTSSGPCVPCSASGRPADQARNSQEVAACRPGLAGPP